jgi:hypothetical protein
MKYLTRVITPERVLAFVAELMLNMLQPFPGGIESRWRTDSHFIHRADNVPLVMSRDEFRAIKRCIRFYRPEDLDQTDKFTKLRVIIDTINLRFKKAVRMGVFVSFYEATVSSRSNWLPARQYNPMKPHKFGLKLFMTCCAVVVGYCYSIEVYQGKNRDAKKPELENEGNDDMWGRHDSERNPSTHEQRHAGRKRTRKESFSVEQ